MKTAVWHERVIPESREALYEYSELSESAKDKVRREHLDYELATGIRVRMLHEDYKNMWLNYHFPNSDLKVQYSLASCQGDGVNVYDEFDFDDLIEYCKYIDEPMDFSEEEMSWLRENIKEYSSTTVLENHWYSYCTVQSKDYFSCDWECDLQFEMDLTEEQIDLLYKLSTVFYYAIRKLCKDMENYGYDFLYEISDEEMKDTAEANEWLYYEDGTLYDGNADELLEVS